MCNAHLALTRNLGGPSAARQFFEEWLATVDPSRETLWVAHVDEKRDCLYLARYDGDESSAPCPPNEILADALEHKSAGIILAHNHPRCLIIGPSMQDIRITRQLAACVEALGCAVLDHLVFAGTECTSFREHGLL